MWLSTYRVSGSREQGVSQEKASEELSRNHCVLTPVDSFPIPQEPGISDGAVYLQAEAVFEESRQWYPVWLVMPKGIGISQTQKTR